MSEAMEYFRDAKDFRKHLRSIYGVPCPECVRLLPRANPSLLLPEQTCRIHRYRDPRPESVMDAEFEQREAR